MEGPRSLFVAKKKFREKALEEYKNWVLMEETYS